MANGNGRWKKLWKLNADPAGILGGVKDQEFRLEPVSGTGRPRFKFAYDPDDESDVSIEFREFVEWGQVLPSAPWQKLKSWKHSEERNYRRLIDNTFADPDLKVLRLTGEKIVDGQEEWMTMFLIPDVTEWHSGAYKDLIFVTCRTSLDAELDSLRRRLASLIILQDGTAHGNPK